MSPRYKLHKLYSNPHNINYLNRRHHFFSRPKLDVNTMLGRKINNFSRSQYKFIKRKPTSSILFKEKHTRGSFGNKQIQSRYTLKNFRVTKKSSLTTNALKSSTTNVQKILASNLVHRSIRTIALKKNSEHKLTINKSKKLYCKYFNLFGKCNKSDACKFIHDPNHISICSRFLRGTCDLDKSCLFSHDFKNEKIPLCSFFINGCCNRDNCPYLHVFNGKRAEFCKDFASGFCKLGKKCLKAHLTICLDYTKSQTCPRGNKCPLQHKISTIKSHQTQSPKHISQEIPNEDSQYDEKESFISIETNMVEEKEEEEKVEEKPQVLKIRPTFFKETNKVSKL